MWKYYQPVEVVFGNGELNNIGKYMEQRNFDRALIVADPIAVKMGITDKVMKAANGRVLAVISEVEPNPTIQNINCCAQKAREIGAQCIIAIGGGSAIDCGKSTGVAVADNCSGEDLLAGHVIKASLPLIAIPTTSGTGSEVTAGAVISDKEKQIKSAIFSESIFPKLAIVDPELTYSCPPSVTASTGIDVLAHALDSITSVKSQPATDALALKAAKLVLENLEKAVADGNDKFARENMSMASVIAGLAFSQTGTTGSHACSYILTAKYRVPHGEACAFTLDSWMIINAKEKPILDEYAKELGFENTDGLAIRINELKTKFGMKLTLKDVGIQEEDLAEVVNSCLQSGNMKNNLAQIGFEGVYSLYHNKR